MDKINDICINNIEIYYNNLYKKLKLRVNYNIRYENSPYFNETNDIYKCPKEVKEKVKNILKEFL